MDLGNNVIAIKLDADMVEITEPQKSYARKSDLEKERKMHADRIIVIDKLLGLLKE